MKVEEGTIPYHTRLDYYTIQPLMMVHPGWGITLILYQFVRELVGFGMEFESKESFWSLWDKHSFGCCGSPVLFFSSLSLSLSLSVVFGGR